MSLFHILNNLTTTRRKDELPKTKELPSHFHSKRKALFLLKIVLQKRNSSVILVLKHSGSTPKWLNYGFQGCRVACNPAINPRRRFLPLRRVRLSHTHSEEEKNRRRHSKNRWEREFLFQSRTIDELLRVLGRQLKNFLSL